jgi:hypothetical protein
VAVSLAVAVSFKICEHSRKSEAFNGENGDFWGGFDVKMTFLGRKMAFLGGFTWENGVFFWVILSEKMVKSPTTTNKKSQ